ncbi:PIN domain-containing protein [Fulvimarina sp. 2208YS6-2-32]|uniref:PIN domain-containing protein n=1 Tax=Fulvimarina uroteuthidis TaxID=3098149 RepID=A0ABU5I673_9HYPH|nr:PIN domain-containing protein [Fulvimarina sp. 2208YS6-2-32]MDY8110711.1 PIN domain-containing protein [Fulvimarina sp. 2208YS6-2-32]
MNAAFFDTNIIAYAADVMAPDPSKRDTARHLMQTRAVVTSTQVMLELYSVMRRKFSYPAETALAWVAALRDDNVVALSPDDVVEALKKANRYGISHWDGLILIAASRAGLDLVYTEDLNHGQTYGDVRVCNPFIEDFLA